MNDLLKLKRVAEQLNICGRYRRTWDNAANLQDIMDMALSAQGIEFVCDGCAFGWGLTQEYILKKFGDYINGRYQRNMGGYTSEMYVEAKGEITLRSTLNLLVGCNCTIVVPERHICKVYVCNSSVRLDCKGHCEVYVYGDGCEVIVADGLHSDVTLYKEHKSHWVKEECQEDGGERV